MGKESSFLTRQEQSLFDELKSKVPLLDRSVIQLTSSQYEIAVRIAKKSAKNPGFDYDMIFMFQDTLYFGTTILQNMAARNRYKKKDMLRLEV